MSFRILNQSPAYLNTAGQPLAGGELRFYTTGTTTPKNVYGDAALTINNGSTVTLDSSGRANVDVWGDGEYRVRLYDSLGVQIWQRDNVREVTAAGATIPSMVGKAGQFLTNDGSVTLWQAIRQLPDPTGHAGKVLGTDGTVFLWQASTASTAIQGVFLRQTVTAAATTTIDLALGTVIKLDQAVNITSLVFTNAPTTGAYVISIRRVKDATGTARTITWPAAWKWPGGVAPTLTQTSGAIDEISVKVDDGVYTATHRLAYA